MTVSLQYNTINRNKLFYNKYLYRASFKLFGARFTYYTSNLQEYYRKIIHAKTKEWYQDFDWDSINFHNVEEFFAFKTQHSNDISVRIESDKLSIFSNDLSILQSIKFNESEIICTKIELGEPDVIQFVKKPKYSYRIYFKNHRTSTNFSEEINDIREKINQGKYDAFISRRLCGNMDRGWIRSRRYLYGTYYIDFNNESLQTILHMLLPGALGKTYKLVQKT